MLNAETLIKKYSSNYKLFNKKAAGEGLKYVRMELSELEAEIRDLETQFRVGSDVKREYANRSTAEVMYFSLESMRKLLDSYWKTSNDIFSKFKKAIVKNHKDQLETIITELGNDYLELITEVFPGADLSSGPKYKMLMDLVCDEDKPLMDEALTALSLEPTEYGDRYNVVLTQYNKAISGKNLDWDWVYAYDDLMKFAQDADEPEIEYEELDVDITLKPNERKILEIAISTWQSYKAELDKYIKIGEHAAKIDEAWIAKEEFKHEGIASAFDRIRALKHMVDSYVKGGDPADDFFDKVGMTINNVYSKIDIFTWRLVELLPSKYIKSLHSFMGWPRKLNEDETPEFRDYEEEFFDQGKDYEEGERSGIEEEPGVEVINKRPKENGLNLMRSYRPAFDNAVNMLKKTSRKN